MVWSRERDCEKPPLSVILPRFYLGAESDVTQDRLASLGISYVLSVSRCSPQPSFLPRSRYLRIPIDDSLWDDLLPWIPQALHFIDAAMSSGASVLVHCAAGISRSPALAVAYIMHSLGMDLDQAYRFVKERRPSISPNFNFLGQLQLFQGTLRQKNPADDFILQQADSFRAPISDGLSPAHTSHMKCDADIVRDDAAEIEEETPSLTDRTQQRLSEGDKQLSPSDKPKTLSQTQKKIQRPHMGHAPWPHESVNTVLKPIELQLPSGSASLLEKRKSLTLSLTPLGISPTSPAGRNQPAKDHKDTLSRRVHSREPGGRSKVRTQRGPGSSTQMGPPHREKSLSNSRYSREEVQDHGLLSPFSFTLNKLLGWGERVLLGGFFVHSVRMGQPSLPDRC
ncbi:probable dual specificity protein phosphatase DDB_G0281963 [Echeneis naucrates]|uniref:protein-tyrosine-phosphatase n=1 Tax=Echeneis naucrates TaxID=173247 RepID=A0A665UEQ4_ECHNA|nr:probable dual specificity protein phosphatase DDB_G0281963 [Echeneis naucrates]